MRTAIVTSDELLRHGLVHMMSRTDNVQLVGNIRPDSELAGRLHGLRPELLVLGGDRDIALPALLATLHPRPKVVVVVDTGDAETDPLDIIRAGADGLIDRRSTSAELLTTLMRVAAGHNAMDSSCANAVITALRSPAGEPEELDMPMLTRREQEVLQLLTHGLDNRTIARSLFISEATVKFHLHNIMGKFGVHRRAALVSTALRGKVIGGR
ncbi:MAG: response regulator transcription factor [Actinomycetota bacterium]|nr:response regulator transcription factor [Actinomycetota bacterium]